MIFTSCDFSTGIEGKVIDKETGIPISHANINLLDGQDIELSDASGYFKVYCNTGAYKVNPIITVTKNGYKPFKIKIENSKDKINYIVSSESFFVEYDEPFYPDTNNRKTFISGTWINKWSQNFIVDDTLTILLNKDDIDSEIERIQHDLRKN